MDKFKDLDDKALSALLVEKQTAAAALVEAVGESTPTTEQGQEALALTAAIEEVEAEVGERTAAAAATSAAFAALSGKVTASTEDAEAEAQAAAEAEAAAAAEAEAAEQAEKDAAAESGAGDDVPAEGADAKAEPVAAAKKTGVAAALAAKTKRPQAPEVEEKSKGYTIRAGAETGFVAGQALDGIQDIAKAAIHRLSGMAPPSGSGEGEDLKFFGIGNIKVDYPENLTVTRQTSDEQSFETLMHAVTEKRLEGESLTAAGGWCAPSETLYDLAADESLDGILSVPEIGVSRGGVRWTPGPQFADFYANAGFAQTEAQAIAGTTKPCYEVSCPEFTEIRLEAVGLCIKVPILTQSAYPELVNRFTSGTLIAHEHWLNARTITKMVALSGSLRTFTGIGSTVDDAMSALELVANQRRQTYRLSFNRSMEVVVPYWVKSVLRDDLAARNGVGADAITDAQVAAHFTVRNIQVQYVYDWQDLVLTDEAYPAAFRALVYPSGTFVKGVSDVINLSAVYDAASLAVNTYTGLFMERGMFVANMQYSADYIEIPIESVGRTGRMDLATANA